MTTSATDHEKSDPTVTDTPIKRKSLLESSFEQITAQIEELKKTRFNIDSFMQRARSKNSTMSFERLHNKAETAIRKLNAKLDKIKKSLDAGEDDANKIRLLFIEMGEMIPGVEAEPTELSETEE